MSFFKDILNFILPPRCVLCGKILKEDKGFCDDCINKISFINGAVCHCCGQPLGEPEIEGKRLLCGKCVKSRKKIFRMLQSACAYDEISKKLVVDFKFHDKTDLASLLAKMMYVAGKDIFSAGIDVIIPVPLHRGRLLRRRYNQSALLAKEIGKLSGIKVDYESFIKKRGTKPQVDCNGEERLRNLQGAFFVKTSCNITGKRILLVDDVLTTGATLKECAMALNSAAPKSIDALTLARVL